MQVTRTRLQLSQKLVRQRRDEADLLAGLLDSHIAVPDRKVAFGKVGQRESCRSASRARRILQRPVLGKAAFPRPWWSSPIGIDLDEGQVVDIRSAAHQSAQREQVIVLVEGPFSATVLILTTDATRFLRQAMPSSTWGPAGPSG